MALSARITVIAGVNGSGKSSIVGALMRERGGEYFNPDEAARRFRDAAPFMTTEEANIRAWSEGKTRLEHAVSQRTDFALETTLGGHSIAKLLSNALDAGLEVAMVYVGLDAVEKNIARVRSRVQAGGHDIPETKIRERYTSSMVNLVQLAPRLTELSVFDNSAELDPKTGKQPDPKHLVYAKAGKAEFTCELTRCPAWAKPVLMVLLAADLAPFSIGLSPR